MHTVVTKRLAGLGLAAVLTVTAAGGSAAVFSAEGPGDDISPQNGAHFLIDLVQSQESILWSSLAGNVSLVETVGWPSSDGVHELGGALTIERPAEPLAGTINIGEKPMSVEFEIGG